MYTYQDLLEVLDNDEARMSFVQGVIHSHKNSDAYCQAKIADEYVKHRNVTITNYQKLLYTISGEVVPDNYSANYKLCSNFFDRFVTQENQYLLGNGISLDKDNEKTKLGEDFDIRLQELGRYALTHGVGFGFWNLDHMEVFSFLEFAPLYDEEDGALKAGIRFWQIDKSKPLRATLYELDGYTEYIWRDGKGEVLSDKRKYVLKVRETPADGQWVYDGENYPSFPIVPLWGNPERQSEIVGRREQIDAYDLIKSGFASDLDDASQIYWTISNAGGMDDIDLVKFLKHMKTVKAAVIDEDGANAESHTIDVPYASREALLDRIRSDLYEDFMALDTKNIAGGAATATQIKAAYEPLNNKTDMYEYCLHDFLKNIFALAGVDAEASFTRSVIVNTQDEVTTLIQGAAYLDGDYVTQKILELMGDGDKAEEMLKEMDENTMQRIGGIEEGE